VSEHFRSRKDEVPLDLYRQEALYSYSSGPQKPQKTSILKIGKANVVEIWKVFIIGYGVFWDAVLIH
jgi:hypothetical protein